MENKCFYCGGSAVHFFKTANRWCCESNTNRCPAIREKKRKSSLNKYKDSPRGKVRRSIEDGTAKCVYCGDTAHFMIFENKPCCTETAYDCPNHSKARGESIKQKYAENPERCINMSRTMKEVQNRDDVKQKKSNTMIELHRGDCEPCIEFQNNYKEGIEKRNIKNHLKAYDFLINVGFKEEDIPTDMNERAIVVNRVKASMK